jgi:PAS domain S-box-containing protein
MDAIIAADDTGKVLVFNPAAERLFGYKADEILGQEFSALLLPSDVRSAHSASMRRHLEKAETGNFARRIEATAMTKAGVTFPVEVSLARDNSWAQPVFTAVIRDIRVKRGLELALQQARDEAWAASDAKSEFIAVLSHELRTPLSSIVSSTGLLEAQGLSADAHELVRIQRDAGEALLALTSNILDVSRLEAGAESLDRDAFDPIETARQAMRILQSRADAAGVRLILESDDSVPGAVIGDLRRWRQVLLNLITNALKFTNRGSVTVTLDGTAVSSTSCLLRASVTDTGIGMSEESLGRIFHPYEQATTDTKAKYGGTGLGLHIVRQLVEAMGGTMSVGSTAGVGSTFAFAIPMSLDLAEGLIDSGSTVVKPLLVLLVEDHDVNRRLVQKQLEALGHSVVAVGSSAETLTTVWLQPFDVVLMDVGLPDGDGFSTTRAIVEQASTLGRNAPPVVALTAGDASEVRDAARAAGMTAFLTKPLQVVHLQRVFEELSESGGPTDSGASFGTSEMSVAATQQVSLAGRAQLDDLAAGVGWKAVLQAADLFAGEMPRRLAVIADAAAAGDRTAVAEGSHALRGVASTMGASELASLCRTVEQGARSGTLPDVEAVARLNSLGDAAAIDVLDYVKAHLD